MPWTCHISLVLWLRQNWKRLDGSLHARDAILPKKIREMYIRRNPSCQISLVERVQRLFEENDWSYENNETMKCN